MYTAFYGLREKPFSLSPDPRFLFLSAGHREALAHILYGIEQGEGFIAITGEVGTGKTTLCRTLLQRLGPDTEVAFVFNPTLSGDELIRTISAEYGLLVEGLTRGQLNDQLNRFLLDMKSKTRRVLLIIDEAQNLSAETLEEIRLLSNLETSTSKLIQILLFGQPELDDKIDSQELRQLRQRISVRWSLRPLSNSETSDYVRHRLRVARGGECDIFSEPALREIRRRANGIPRLVNLLADRSLLAGFGAGANEVGARLVDEAAREILGAHQRRKNARRRAVLRNAGAAAALVVAVVAGTLGAVAWFERNELDRNEAAAPVASQPVPGVASGPQSESAFVAPIAPIAPVNSASPTADLVSESKVAPVVEEPE